MNMKKLLAAAAASVVAVSAAVFSSSAAIVEANVGNIDGTNYVYDLVAEGVDYENMTSVTITMKVESPDDGFGGGVMYNGMVCGWDQDDENRTYCDPNGDKNAKVVDAGDGTFTLTLPVPAGEFGTNDQAGDDGFYAQIFVQQWWGGDMTIVDVEAGYDAAPEPDPEPEVAVVEEAPAAGDVAAATDSSKGSPDTGIADVAAVAGLALVAAGAVVVSKKRK